MAGTALTIILYPVFMSTKITRRQVAAAAVGAVGVLAQTPTPPLPRNPEEELKAAREDARQRGDQLTKFLIPISTEPAVQFRA